MGDIGPAVAGGVPMQGGQHNAGYIPYGAMIPGSPPPQQMGEFGGYDNRIQPMRQVGQMGNWMQPGGGQVGIEPWQRRPQQGPAPGGGFTNFMSQLQGYLQGIPQQNQQMTQQIQGNNATARQGIMDQNQAFRAQMPQPRYHALPVQGNYGAPQDKPMWPNPTGTGGY